MSDDWARCDSIDEVVEWMDEQLSHAADEARDWMIRECGMTEAEQDRAMAQVWAKLDEARERGLREISRAFERLDRGTAH